MTTCFSLENRHLFRVFVDGFQNKRRIISADGKLLGEEYHSLSHVLDRMHCHHVYIQLYWHCVCKITTLSILLLVLS